MRAAVRERVFAAGVPIAADVVGDPEDPPVVLLHGGGQTRHSWAGAAHALAVAGWCAVSMDSRGHGDSGWAPDGDYSLSAFADDLRAVCGALPSPPVLVGASLGGIASIIAAAEEPRVPAPGLVLVDVAPRLEAAGVDRIGTFMRSRATEGFASLDEAADLIASYRPERPRPSNLDGLRKNLRERGGRWYWHWDPAFMQAGPAPASGVVDRGERIDEDRLSEDARSLTMPILLVRGGSSDVVSPAGAEHLRSLVPAAEVVDIAEAGHMVAGDRNDSFTAAVVDFLERRIRPALGA